MKAIITGGTGQIGQALAESLAADHHEVIVLSRDPQSAKAKDLPTGVRVEKWDGRSGAGWAHLAEGADAIVNLAGANLASSKWSPERKRLILESRLQAGQAVVDAVSQTTQKPSVVIQSSAVGFYGPYTTEQVTEGLPSGQDFLADVCAQWEASTVAVEQMGVRRAVIRTGVVLDTGAGALQFMKAPFSLFTGGPIGDGKQPFPWIHPQDEVRAIRFLIEHPEASGPFNLAAPGVLTNAEFSAVLGKVMGRPSYLTVPAFAMKLLVGELSFVLLTGQRAVPARLQELGFEFAYPQAEGALRQLLQGEPAFDLAGVQSLAQLILSRA